MPKTLLLPADVDNNAFEDATAPRGERTNYYSSHRKTETIISERTILAVKSKITIKRDVS